MGYCLAIETNTSNTNGNTNRNTQIQIEIQKNKHQTQTFKNMMSSESSQTKEYNSSEIQEQTGLY